MNIRQARKKLAQEAFKAMQKQDLQKVLTPAEVKTLKLYDNYLKYH